MLTLKYIREEGHVTFFLSSVRGPVCLRSHSKRILCDLRQEAQCGLCLFLVLHLISDEQDRMSLKQFVADSLVLAFKVSWDTQGCFSSLWDQCVGVSSYTAIIEQDPPKY